MLINADWTRVVNLPDGFPIMTGEYDDFSVDWYTFVGSTIAVSTFINAMATLSMAGDLFISLFLQLFDSSCSCNAKRTRKVLQSEYLKLYTGENQELEVYYSEIIAITMIIMLLGSSMPLLYLAGLLLCLC
jgi:hypothetical protein